MAVKIRLRQQGRANGQTYRLVACDIRTKRDGKYLDMLGWYDPRLKEKNAHVDEEKAKQWLDSGAEMSEDAFALIKRVAPGVIKEWTDRKVAKQAKQTTKKREARRTKSKAAAKA